MRRIHAPHSCRHPSSHTPSPPIPQLPPPHQSPACANVTSFFPSQFRFDIRPGAHSFRLTGSSANSRTSPAFTSRLCNHSNDRYGSTTTLPSGVQSRTRSAIHRPPSNIPRPAAQKTALLWQSRIITVASARNDIRFVAPLLTTLRPGLRLVFPSATARLSAS